MRRIEFYHLTKKKVFKICQDSSDHNKAGGKNLKPIRNSSA